METLEELKAIVKNAPDGATSIGACNDTDSISYLKSDPDSVSIWYHWVDGGAFIVDYDFTVVFDDIRSLSDIKRIIELMENQKKAYKAYESLESVKQKYNGENKIAKAMLRLAYHCDKFALPVGLRKDIKNFLGDL